MNLRDKKLAVLHQLSQEAESTSLQALLEKLGADYVERTVRRWLSEMVKEGLVEKLGNRRATTYRVAHRSGRQMHKASSCFGSESAKIIKLVRRPLYERLPIAYVESWLDAYQPNKTFYIPLQFRLQLYKAGERSKREDPAGTYAHQIFNRFLIDLSYNSSRLEGNTYSLLDTQKLLLEGASAEGKLDEEKVMILNHKEAIRYLVDSAQKLEMVKQTICTVHYLLADGLVDSHDAGRVRSHTVRIGGSTYVPIEGSKRLGAKLELIAKKAALIEDSYEQSFFLLVHITYLQAFSDVNKRTARLCANISLIKNNLVPLSFNDVERDDYISAVIAIYELQDIRPILDLYIFSYLRTCAMYDSTIKTIGFDEVRVRYRQQRRSVVREIILKKIKEIDWKKYIASQTLQLIKPEDQAAFIEDVLEDLKEIDESRIAGLGLTSEQLESWMHR